MVVQGTVCVRKVTIVWWCMYGESNGGLVKYLWGQWWYFVEVCVCGKWRQSVFHIVAGSLTVMAWHVMTIGIAIDQYAVCRSIHLFVHCNHMYNYKHMPWCSWHLSQKIINLTYRQFSTSLSVLLSWEWCRVPKDISQKKYPWFLGVVMYTPLLPLIVSGKNMRAVSCCIMNVYR
jgi:hypothetical protein